MKISSAVFCLTVAVVTSSAYGLVEGWVIGGLTNRVVAGESDPGYFSTIPLGSSKNGLKKSNAKRLLGASAKSTAPSLSLNLPTNTNSRVSELVRGLGYDWRRCYDFVRDNIAYVPYVGIMRGPVKTILDEQGNDADQALLLYTLLKESGYENVKLVYKPLVRDDGVVDGVFVPYADGDGCGANSWLGLPSDIDPASTGDEAALILGRLGRGVAAEEGGVWTDLFWVELTIDGNKIVLNPSIKPHRRHAPSDIINNAMNYSREDLLAAAGGEVGDCYVSDISADGLKTILDEFTSRLEKEFTRLGLTGEDILSFGNIEKRKEGEPREGLGANIVLRGDTEIDVFSESESYINDNMRAKVTLTLGGVTLGEFFMDEIGERNVWIASKANGNGLIWYGWPVYYNVNVSLYVDDTVVGQVNNRQNGTDNLIIAVKHPQQSMERTYSIEHSCENDYFNNSPEYVFVLFSGTECTGRGNARKLTTERLASLRHDGVANNDRRMLVASSAHAGQQFLTERSRLKQVKDLFESGHQIDTYTIGISGKKEGPYFDIKNTCGQKLSDIKMFDATDLFSSSLEHAIIEQLNGNCPAVSTVKLLSLANQSGMPIYFISKDNYTNSVDLLQNYSSGDLTDFREYAAQNYVFLVPRDYNITLNEWTGGGYVSFGPVSADVSYVMIGMAINGGFNGGNPTKKTMPDAAEYFNNSSTSYYQDGSKDRTVQSDPISMPDGSYLDKKTDLTIARHSPLSWTRSYFSDGHYDDSGLGYGWSHSFDASIVESTDIDAFFGDGSACALAPTIVAIKAASDLLADQKQLSDGENARHWTLAALVTQWWTDKIGQNAVSVKLGSQMLNFTRNADGTFASSPGVTATLSKEESGYVLQERNGNRYCFNQDNKLSSIVDSSGNVTRLLYSGGKLVRIENDFDAAINVEWNGEHICRVGDGDAQTVSYEYDDTGCLTQVVDASGKIWTATYDSESKVLLTKTNPDGQLTVQNTYNEFFQVTNQVSAAGGNTVFGYAGRFEAWDINPLGGMLFQKYAQGRPWMRQERDGATTYYNYDSRGNKIATIDAKGNICQVGYDSNNNVTSVKEGSGTDERFTRMSYDGQNRLIDIEDASGEHKTFEYDGCNRIVKSTEVDGSFATNTWLDNGLLSESKTYSSNGYCFLRTTYEYGEYGLPVAVTVYGDGIPETGYRTATEYSHRGLAVKITDPNGSVSTFDYDDSGRLLSATDALDRTAARSYTESGYLQSATDAKGRTVSYTVNAAGNPELICFADGAVISNAYDLADNLISVKDERGAVTLMIRDSGGRLIATASPVGKSSIGYDELGNPIVTTNAAGVVTRTEYDSLSRPVSVIDGRGNEWRTQYDALGRVVATVSPLGTTTKYGYDKIGRRIAAERPSGAYDLFGYDDAGALSVYTNAEGAVYSITHDALGRVTSIENAIGNTLFNGEYDSAGNLIHRKDGEGNSLAFNYDACSRLVSKGGGESSASFSYDDADNLILAEKGAVRETFEYNQRDWLTNAKLEIDGQSFTTDWAYDSVGNATNIIYNGANAVARTYDDGGRLVSVEDWLGHVWRMTYDGDGKLLSLISPDGAGTVYRYDAAGQLEKWNIIGITGRRIKRDAMGRKSAESITHGASLRMPDARTATNCYNAADQLIAAQVTIAGNTVDETYTYDGNGALVLATSTSGDSIAFGYTAEQQLASVACGGNNMSFSYDALGNRIADNSKYWIPDLTDPLKRPLMECSSSGAILRYYIWGEGRLLGFIDSNGTLTVAHADDYGSVIALTDESGNVQWRANYGPHGEDCGTEGANPTPFAWLGGFGVQKLGVDSFMGAIYNTRHRLYSVNQHRFLSADPMGLNGGLNLYAYGNCNAVAYIDPLGLCPGFDWGSLLTRLGGGLRMAGGFVETLGGVAMMGAGAVSSEIGVGIFVLAAGGAVTAHGADQFQAGLKTLWTGKNAQSHTSVLIQSGYNFGRQTADLIDGGVSILFTAGASSFSSVGSANAVAGESAGTYGYRSSAFNSLDNIRATNISPANNLSELQQIRNAKLLEAVRQGEQIAATEGGKMAGEAAVMEKLMWDEAMFYKKVYEDIGFFRR